MHAIALEIPEDVARHIRLPQRRAKKMLMQELALRLFEQRIVTAAQAARLVKMTRLDFEHLLAENEIPFHGEADDLRSDLANTEPPDGRQ